MAHALGVERAVLLLDPSRFAAPADFEALVARRLAHEPVAYILGTRDFWTIRLRVGPGVLIPRPDSETLIEAAIAHFGSRRSEEHTSELQSLMRISYAVFCLKKKNTYNTANETPR